MLGRNKVKSIWTTSDKSPRKKQKHFFNDHGQKFASEYFKTPFMRACNNVNQGGPDDDLRISMLRNVDTYEYSYEFE